MIFSAAVSYNQVVNYMNIYDYYSILLTTGLWTHRTRRTKLSICVDDYGVEYFNKYDAYHILSSLAKHYSVSTDWGGKKYPGLHIDWNS